MQPFKIKCPLLPRKLNCCSIISQVQFAVSKMQQHATELQGLGGHLLGTGVCQRAGRERSGKVKMGRSGGGLNILICSHFQASQAPNKTV